MAVATRKRQPVRKATASICNAFPLEGVKNLAEFMADFAKKNG
jgi:phosphoserine aminotransferase